MKQKGVDTSAVKLQNRQIVYHYIHDHGHVSRQDIAYGLKLSLPTVISNVEYLRENRLIESTSEMQTTGGRKASTYAICKNTKMAIGLYLTGHHIHAALVDLSGGVVYTETEKALFNLDDDVYLCRLATMVERVWRSACIDKETILGVGIALPGILSEDNESVVIGASMDFTGKTKEQITKYIDFDCRLIHDSFAAVFAETWNGFQDENVFYIGLNNYVGGAAMIHGQVFNGNSNRGGEIGHVKLATELGKRCYCGQTGCFETACAATVLSSLTEDDLDLFFYRLKQGEPKLVEAWESYLHYLAKAIRNIHLLYDSTVIIGGYVGARIHDYLKQLCEIVDEESFFGDSAEDYVRQCKYTVEDVGAGAALLFIDEFIRSI